MQTAISIKQKGFLSAKLADYAALVKFKLSFTVAISAGLGYLFGISFSQFDWLKFALFLLASMLVTFSANTINEIIEKDTDKLMTRTMNRPLPTVRMSMTEALLAAGIMGISGILILLFEFNSLAALLAAISLLSYAFLYTPMKKISSFAVFVGAIPGALPPAIGYVCAEIGGEFNYFVAATLFAVQFFWQFPHFWSIAWIRFDEYKNAGIMLLPSATGKTWHSSIHAFIYSMVLLVVSLIPYFFEVINIYGAALVLIMGVGFSYLAFMFFKKCDDLSAKKLMFASFAYLPLVQLIFVLSRLK